MGRKSQDISSKISKAVGKYTEFKIDGKTIIC